MLTPETVLQSRYRIIRKLGQGGMGAVYEAIDERLDSTVALKETLFADERLRKQFEREARLLARMHHPALPRVSDHFAEGDGQFLIMQFIVGDDLAEMITRKHGPFPADQVVIWADQLLDALDYLHTQDPQIIHRDIKPQNLKLTSRGQIILLDFGLAKGQASEISRVATSASIFGYTPNYAPLEQIQGLGTDARSDIYALAATLYHLTTGVKPPDALTRAAAIVNGQPDPLKLAHEVNNALDPALAGVLQRAMAQNRDQRYANAAEMRRALQRGSSATVISRGEAETVLLPLPAPTVAPIKSPKTSSARNQTHARVGETTVVRHRETSKSGRGRWAIAGLTVLLLAATVGGFYAYQLRNKSAAVPAVNNLASPAVDQSAPVNSDSANSGSTSASDVSVESQPAEAQSQPAEAESQRAAAIEKAARKKEQAITQKERAEKLPETKASPESNERGGGEGHPEQALPTGPDIPSVNLPDVPRIGGSQGARHADGFIIRNLPDGTQVIIAPDGSRVIVRPDGSRQMVRPGGRIDRRRMRPRP